MRYFNYGSDLVDYRRGCFVISKNEHVSGRVTAELDRLADEKEAAEAREAKLREALEAIVKRPDGCPWCDSGVLRNPEKGHGPDCGFAKAGALAASLAPCTHNAGVYQLEGDFRCKGCDAPMPDDAGKKKKEASR